MKQTNARIFLDTNILVYAYSKTELEKQAIARKLISECNTFVSTQVLQELTNTLTKKFHNSWHQAQDTVHEACKNNQLYVNESETILKACTIADKYKYSFYDSLIISAALSCGCAVLYTEDLHDGLMVENKLKIINPFRKT
ncbi:MAG: PIN domain-containing protein [Salinivirgaceae bacterium]|jgi:predicted nucleic acid-binding protein